MISLLCPTRKRPHWMERLWKSIVNTADDLSNIELIFYLDKDDKAGIKKFEKMKSERIRGIIGERIILSNCWNECWKIAQGPYYMLCADDIVFESKSWDTILLKAFDNYPDKIAVVYGRDGIKDWRLSTHPFVHKNWTDTLGYFVPPYFSAQMNDLWIFELGKGINRLCYVPEIFTRHTHPGKKATDDTYREQKMRARTDGVRKIYNDKETERRADMKKLRKRMK